MTIYEVVGLLMVCAMMRLVFVATRFVSNARCNNKGIWFIAINGYLRRKERYLEWLKHNQVYLWSSLLVCFLCVSILGLVGSFVHNKMFDRPKLVLIIAPFLWLTMERCYSWFSKRVPNK